MLCCPRLVDTGIYQLEIDWLVLEIELHRRCYRVTEQGEGQ